MSEDDGKTFRLLGKREEFSYLEIAKAKPNVWYRIAEHRNLYRSDNAASGPWLLLEIETQLKVTPSTETGSDFRATHIAVHAMDPGLLFVSSTKGLLRSRDYGTSWSLVDLKIPAEEGVGAMAFDPRYADTAYVATKRGFYISRNRGESWTNVDIEAEIGDWSFRLLKFVNDYRY